MKRPTIKVMGAFDGPMSQVKTTPYEEGEYDPKDEARRLYRFLCSRVPVETFHELRDLMIADDDPR